MLWSSHTENAFCNTLFPPEIRRVVYTTNAIESLNARFRQATRRRGHFPNDQAALKVLYLVIRTPRTNRANVTGKTGGWKAALNALALYYGDRITETKADHHPPTKIRTVPASGDICARRWPGTVRASAAAWPAWNDSWTAWRALAPASPRR
jgi:Transposase, Mutator family